MRTGAYSCSEIEAVESSLWHRGMETVDSVHLLVAYADRFSVDVVELQASAYFAALWAIKRAVTTPRRKPERLTAER